MPSRHRLANQLLSRLALTPLILFAAANEQSLRYWYC